MEVTGFAIFSLILSGYSLFVTSKSINGHLDKENEVGCGSKNDYLNSPDCVKGTLKMMGYLKPSDDLNQYRQAIENYQTFYKLKVTGIVDEETAALLAERGCGVPDIISVPPEAIPDQSIPDQSIPDKHIPDKHILKRLKRQIAFISRPYWPFTRISWCISAYSRHLTTRQQDDAIKWALQEWADHSRLTFSRVSDCRRAVIELKWATGFHDDFNDFDGPGKTLAHAILPSLSFFLPRLAGDVHFDDDENWSVSSASDVSGTSKRRSFLKPIALHELGHSLGLVHSNLRDSIMYKYYTGNDDPVLHQTDIDAIQNYYGSPLSRTTEEPIESLDICEGDSRVVVKAITMMGDGNSYAFNGPRYWRIGRNGLIDTQSKQIRQNWRDTSGRGLEGDFDAVLFIPIQDCKPTCIGNTYFIKGSTVWEMLLNEGISGVARRKDLLDVFPQSPINIDGALLWKYGIDSTKHLHIYFIKGREYFRAGSDGPPYRMISVNQMSVLWDQDWREGNFQAGMVRWDYNHATGTADLDNCFFQFGYYGCYAGGSDQLDEGYPRNIKYWYGCDGFVIEENENEETDGANSEDDADDPSNGDNNDEEPNDTDEPPSQGGRRQPTAVNGPRLPNTSPLCTNLPRIQAVTLLGDGLVYAFSGTHFWRKSFEGESDRMLRNISSNWFGEGLVGNFDAVVFRPNGECNPTCQGTTFFFQQEKIFMQQNSDGTRGFLTRFFVGIFPNLPINIDSATSIPSDRCDRCFDIYFVKGNEHFITHDTHSISYRNPYDVTAVANENKLWHSTALTSVDAMFHNYNREDSSEFYYLFRGNEYYSYDAQTNQAPANPEPVSSWYRC